MKTQRLGSILIAIAMWLVVAGLSDRAGFQLRSLSGGRRVALAGDLLPICREGCSWPRSSWELFAASDDIIDVEESHTGPPKRGQPRKGMLGWIKNILSQAKDKLSPSLSSRQSLINTREQQWTHELHRDLDRMLDGSGLISSAFGGALRSLAGTLSMGFEQDDHALQDIQSKVGSLVEADRRASSRLGRVVRSYSPFSRAKRTFSINGVVEEVVSLQYVLDGSVDSAEVHVEASLSPRREMEVQRAELEFRNGDVISLQSGGSTDDDADVIDV